MTPTDLLVYGLVITTTLAALAWTVERLVAGSRVPRRLAWLGAMGAAVLVLAVAPLRHAPPPASQTATPLAAGPVPASPLATIGAAMRSAVPAPLAAIAGPLWLVLALSGIAGLLVVQRRVVARVRTLPRARVHGVDTRLSPGDGPCVVGLTRPEIVLPWRALAVRDDALRVVLDHEEAHRRARDPLALALGWLATMVLLPFPAAWWMVRRLRHAIECDCDARVLRHRGITPQAYGTALLDAVAHNGGRLAVAPGFTLTPGSLERRLLAMTHRPTRRGVLAAAILTTVTGSLAVAACGEDLPTGIASAPEAAAPQDQEILLSELTTTGEVSFSDAVLATGMPLAARFRALTEAVRNGDQPVPSGGAAVVAGALTEFRLREQSPEGERVAFGEPITARLHEAGARDTEVPEYQFREIPISAMSIPARVGRHIAEFERDQ